MEASDPQENARQRLAQFHKLLGDMSDKDAIAYGTALQQKIAKFNASDTLDAARAEGRMVYRSWPVNADATNSVADLSDRHEDLGTYTSGFSSLTTTRNPDAFKREKAAFKATTSHDPLASAPATLLGNDAREPSALWSGSGPGMVVTLLPESYYMAFDAFNQRSKTSNDEQLKALGKQMRAETTRPDLFDNKDLSSGVLRIDNKTQRFGKPSMQSLDPKTDKDSLRLNAIMYQTFMATNPGGEIHNEMAVKFRQSGLYVPAKEMVQREVQHPSKLLGLIPARTETVTVPENTGRDTRALATTLGLSPNTSYEVRKK